LTFKAPLENINYAAAATAIFNSARDIPGNWSHLFYDNVGRTLAGAVA
jgi:hypothetical protein